MKPIIRVEVLRGTPCFANACRIAAASLAMMASAHAAAPVETPADQFFARPVVAMNSATDKLSKLLCNQSKPAEAISSEQAQTLQYGTYYPVKTAVSINGKTQIHWTIHPFDLVKLSRQAAQEASRTEGIKIDPLKVGAIMMAESSLVARTGWSANGKTPSYSLAQMEPNTARLLGVKDPNDPLQSALGVAKLVAEGMRFARSNGKVDEHIAMSLAYNTSTSLRRSLVTQYGSALRLEHLPPATQNHVKNMAYGEGRMAAFSKLNDQHDKLTLALKKTQEKLEIAMNTSHAPAPVPSTRTLVASMGTEQANQMRLDMNQTQLEKAGHLQAAPMTAKGLGDMRMAIGDQMNALKSLSDPSAIRSAALNFSTQLASKVSVEVAALTQSMTQKISAAVQSIKEMMTASTKAAPPIAKSPASPAVASGLPAPTLRMANAVAGTTMKMSVEQAQQVREQHQQHQQHGHLQLQQPA